MCSAGFNRAGCTLCSFHSANVCRSILKVSESKRDVKKLQFMHTSHPPRTLRQRFGATIKDSMIESNHFVDTTLSILGSADKRSELKDNLGRSQDLSSS